MNADSTTTAVLTAVRRAVDEITPAEGADTGLPQVLTAARARRRRRRVTACGGAAGAGIAVSAALSLDAGAPDHEAVDAAAAGRPVVAVDQLTTGQEAIR